MGFTVDELAIAAELSSATCASLLKRLSQDFGYRSSQHPETFHRSRPSGKRIVTRMGLGRPKSTPEGDGNLIDHCCLAFVHEHAEANPHKNNGLAIIVAGHAGRLATGRHTETIGTIANLYVTLADEVLGSGSVRSQPSTGS
ncbi:MAG: hypothetical protein ABSH24_30725 [Bryobacteraceae bacterium]|jgi:hypothetical protein